MNIIKRTFKISDLPLNEMAKHVMYIENNEIYETTDKQNKLMN